MVDAQVVKECWASCVPVRLRLADSEVTTVEQPPVLYFLVPRHSYLISLVPKALPFLQHVLPPGEDTPWIEHNSLPLKWSVPAGPLFDLLAGEGELPWNLTLHFRGYPSGLLPAYGGEEALRGSLFNSLKEAAFICRGSSLRVMEMSPGAQEDLYRSVLQQDLPLFRSVLHSLQLAPVARAGRQPAIPLRLYVRMGGRGYLSSYEGIGYTSRPVECQRADGSLVTLGEALRPLVAEYLSVSGAEPGGAGSASAAHPPAPPRPGEGDGAAGEGYAVQPSREGSSAAADEAGAAEAAAPVVDAGRGEGSAREQEEAPGRGTAGGAAAGNEQQTPDAEAGGAAPAAAAGGSAVQLHQVLVCGVAPPLNTPLAWVHANMHAGDLFLYVTAHVSSSQ